MIRLTVVVIYAVMSGGFNALLPTILVEVFGPEHYASVNGFLYFIRGCGAFMGTPVGGLLLPGGRSHGMLSPTEYTKIILFDGALLLGSAMSVGLVRVCFVWSKINVRCSTAQRGAGYGKHKSDRKGLSHSDVDSRSCGSKSCIYLIRNEAKVEEHFSR
jgi:hypothetical protein